MLADFQTSLGGLIEDEAAQRPRAWVVGALARSGVDVKIITWDNERITRNVCDEVGVEVCGVLAGAELAQLSYESLSSQLESVNMFCRVTSQQNWRVLLALTRGGKVFRFLGNCINDAATLDAADVGISGDTAADVAKVAADLVLLDHERSVVHVGMM